jgi:RNA polymerase sigma factor (TIGR02999 family)
LNIAEKLLDLIREDPLSGPLTLPQLTPDVYADLRRLAHSVMRRERNGHTLQPTAVLNEAFSRLIRARIDTKDAVHFFRLAAQAMRHVLVDYARQRSRDKRESPVPDEDPNVHDGTSTPDLLDIDRALMALTEKAPRAAQFLELRYFAGLEDSEIAAIFDVSNATVVRECRLGKACLLAFGTVRSSTQAIPIEVG